MPLSCRDIIEVYDALSGVWLLTEHENIMRDEEIKGQHIVLFDGVCNLCNSSVIFILKYEKSPLFHFTSLQSVSGKQLLAWCGLPQDFLEAVIYIEKGKIHLGSTAALKIGQRLKFPWSMLSTIGLRVPKIVRDWVYRQIGIHRYRWFGKRDVCMVPTVALKSRFYD